MIYTLKINHVQGRAIAINGLVSGECRNDTLQIFHQAREETVVTVGDELGVALWESLHNRQLEHVDHCEECFYAPQHSDQAHREKPTSYTKLEALTTDSGENQQQEALLSQKKREVA